MITSAVSRLEAAGLMNEMNERLGGDETLAAGYRAAHEAYLASRAEIGARSGIGAVPEIDGISAGGMPTRVKCLHVLVGHSLAAGPGVNPLGDEAITAIGEWWTTDRCYCDGAWDTGGEVPSQDLSRHGPQGLPGIVGRPAPVRKARTETPAQPETPAQRKPRKRRPASDPRRRRRLRDQLDPPAHRRRRDRDRSGPPRLTDVVREMRVVRLGQGVDATGEFAQEALDRTFAATAEYAGLIREHGAGKVRFVATSATRDARNRQIFIDGIRELLGVEPEVITGDEEAALSFAGASSVLPSRGQDPVLVVDLGGGSTEFVLGNADGVIAAEASTSAASG